MKSYLIRVGQFGQIGRFRCEFGFDLEFNQNVICRTERGLETGEFLTTEEFDGQVFDGELLRTMTQQDVLLAERLEKNKLAAIEECQKLINKQGLPVAILDAEQTFDGQSLYFYFTGPISPEVDALTDQLAKAYDTKVKFSEFAESLTTGCGPDCGTAAGSGCGSSGCSSCGLKAACSK